MVRRESHLEFCQKLDRLDERQAERELGLRLIAIGSRALMKEAHPKLASSKKAVAMIRRARARLKANV